MKMAQPKAADLSYSKRNATKRQRKIYNAKRGHLGASIHTFPGTVGRDTSKNMGRMEVAVVSGILYFVGNKLAPLLISEYSSIVGATKDLQELHALVQKVIYWLENAEDKVTGSWLRQLKDLAYVADSFVDEFQLKAQKHEASGVMSKFMCTIPKSFIVQSKVKTIKNRFSAFVKETNFSAITNSLPASPSVLHINKRNGETSSLPIVDYTQVLGRDKERHIILSKLLETNEQHDIIIISIVGLGGSGKTTLAQLVFNDARIEYHFGIKLWVTVSQVFNVHELVIRLFEQIANKTSEHQPLQYMRNTISDMLSRKRCLIVLDDVWTGERRLREEVMEHVKNCAPGTRILLTTRSTRVAETMESACILHLRLLSDDESWVLFKRRLGWAEESLDSEFLKVGKEIMNKCGGIPLAVIVLAGVLHGKEQIEEWNAMIDINFVDVEDDGNSIFSSLVWSFYQMPSHLKQCFAICSLFPKGHRIDKEKLIDLWIAHDMITPYSDVQFEYLEDVGHACFNLLLQFSFLYAMSEEHGRVTCVMHDLIHDLAQIIMGEELSLVVPEVATSSTKSYRYFSITDWPLNLPPENLFEEARAMYVVKGDHFKFGKALQNLKHLRSITVEYTESIPTTIFRVINLRYLEISGLKCEVLPEAISDIWSLQALHVTDCDILNLPNSIGNLQKLRTLNLSWCKRLKGLPGSVSNCQMISNIDLSGCIKFEVLPDFIGTYKRLRVLRMSRTEIKRLPSNVTSLGNLQCLDLQHCPELVELPEGLDNLKKLEVLNLEGCPKLRVMLRDIGKLRRHQNVNIFILGENEKCTKISELRNVNGITYVMNPGDEQKACLEDKTGLQRLQLHWGRNDTHKEMNLEAVFNGLQPPSEIKELYVGGYAGRRYAQWMLKQVDGRVKGLSQFRMLTLMTLCGLPNLRHLDGLVGLPGLEELDLRWMPSLRSMSGGPFPSLVKLRMEGLRSLEEVWIVTEGNSASGEEGQMQIGICLSELHIEECPKLKVKPYFPSSLEHLVLHRSNEQLLLSSSLSQGPSSSSSLPPTFHYSHLKELELWGMTTLASPPPASGSKLGWELLQCMTALESLKICQCSGIVEMPESLRNLTSLRSLFINFCSAIFILPEWLGELHSLQKMTIQSCHSLSGLPQSIGHLTSLQELRIERCDELLQLPECLGELCSLRKFDIAGLQGLSFLPESMCRLTSLEELEISDCQGLTSFPEWIRGLPALQKLKITGCPELERRCEREKGEDWHLIKHIRRRQIGLDEGEPAC